MLRLTSTLKLQALIADSITANTLNVVVNFSDKTVGTYGDPETCIPQFSQLSSNAGAVDICDSPAADTLRTIDSISIFNRDTVASTVTVRYSSANSDILRATLEAGECLGFTHSNGWYVNAADGSRKSGAVQDLSGYQLRSERDASSGYVGKTGHAINFPNLLGTIISLFSNANTAIRNYMWPDKDGTVAMVDDITAAAVGLDNVDNTSDADKPVSTAQQTALDLKANLASPTFTGTPLAPTAAAATNTTQIATTAFVMSEVAFAVAGLLDFKGSTDASGNPNYPAASKGDSYVVSVAGKIGGASGKSVDMGDLYVANADNAGGTEASVGSSWFVLEHNLAGALLAANNLSDVANAATARSNLGLGALATVTPGTGVATALAVNVGTAGAPVVNGGALGTPSSGVATNLTGTASGLTAGNVTTNANLTGHVTSVGNAAVLGSFTKAQLNTAISDADVASLAGAETLTNKRITARVLSEAFSATPAINTDSYDEYHATAMSGAITSMTSSLTGTPVTGDILICEFTDNGTARAITWGASFEASTVALPTITVISTLLTVTLKWNAATSKWRCVGVA